MSLFSVYAPLVQTGIDMGRSVTTVGRAAERFAATRDYTTGLRTNELGSIRTAIARSGQELERVASGMHAYADGALGVDDALQGVDDIRTAAQHLDAVARRMQPSSSDEALRHEADMLDRKLLARHTHVLAGTTSDRMDMRAPMQVSQDIAPLRISPASAFDLLALELRTAARAADDAVGALPAAHRTAIQDAVYGADQAFSLPTAAADDKWMDIEPHRALNAWGVISDRVLKPLMRVSERGHENIPADSKVIVAPSHGDFSDFIVYMNRDLTPLRIMAMKELFDVPVLKHAVTAAGAIPIDRKNPVEGMRLTAALMERGDRFAMFPGGKLSMMETPMPLKTGTARFALDHERPILPGSAYGHKRAYTRGEASSLRSLPHPLIEWGTPIETAGRPQTIREAGRLTEELARANWEIHERLRNEHLASGATEPLTDRQLRRRIGVAGGATAATGVGALVYAAGDEK